MKRVIIPAAFLTLVGLALVIQAQDSADPIRVESVKLNLDPNACMSGRTKMRAKLHVKLSNVPEMESVLEAGCQMRFHKMLEFPSAEGVKCHVQSNMCTGSTGHSFMEAKCTGQDGGAISDKRTFSCPSSGIDE